MNKTLRLTFPQWQGGESPSISKWVAELPPQDAAQGYFIGSKLLEWLAPQGNYDTATVPVSLDYDMTKISPQNGISSYAAINCQLQAALDILAVHQPDKIITLGGECSVSTAPFTYLAEKYGDDVAMIWIDAHPDLNLPFDGLHTGFHAMVLSAIIGNGDEQIINRLPAKLAPKNALIVGLNGSEGLERPARFGIQTVSAQSANQSSDDVLAWLKQTGTSKVMVHFDLDSLDISELRTAVGTDPNGLKIATVSRLINDIAQTAELVGLTVAEPMPREVIKLRNLLHSLPLLGQSS